MRIGEFEIMGELGVGGMARVYLAEQSLLDRKVALKVPLPELSADPDFLARFEAEAKNAARLNHPNVVTIYSTGQADGWRYIAMEYVEGETLEAHIARLGRLAPLEAAEIASQVCAALDAACREGIIHRDISPKNILLSAKTGLVKVTDFGISKALGAASVTRTNMAVGAPPYVSPEALRGDPVDGRSDVYSLGLVLFEMLVGRRAFTGDTPFVVAQQRLQTVPRPPHEVYPDIPEPLSRIAERAIQIDPAHRFQSAEEMRQALQSWATSPGAGTAPSSPVAVPAPVSPLSEPSAPAVAPATPAPATPPTERLTRPRRRRWSAALLALFVLAAIAGGSTALYLFWPKRQGGTDANPPPEEQTEGMVPIEATTFIMGDNEGENDEQPAHPVDVPAFWIDEHEVTNAQYRAFVVETNHPPPPHWHGTDFPEGREDCPVVNVTHEDATAYAEWAGKRLPTEAEWELAARGTDERKWPWGNEPDPDSAVLDAPEPAPVQSKPTDRSPYGCYDMAGNVKEWTDSWYDAYPGAPVHFDAFGMTHRAVRGGCFETDLITLARCAARSYAAPDLKADYIGFRCAWSED